jgi:hypothetical protein
MSVERALLRNQVLDYAESEDRFEQMVGRFLSEQTDELEGEDFVNAVRELLQGVEEVANQFLVEWEINDR